MIGRRVIGGTAKRIPTETRFLNPSFESWSKLDLPVARPSDWVTGDSSSPFGVLYLTAERSSAYVTNGNFSVLYTLQVVASSVFSGTITYSQIDMSLLPGYAKFCFDVPHANDIENKATIKVYMYDLYYNYVFSKTYKWNDAYSLKTVTIDLSDTAKNDGGYYDISISVNSGNYRTSTLPPGSLYLDNLRFI